LEIRAPINGVILEKNFNEGAFIDTSDDVFIIADTSVLQILANVWEEQLPLLAVLPESHRIWKLEVKSDPLSLPRIGQFSLIGRIIDPWQHTAKIVGWLDNADDRLIAGQFITATIEIPTEPGMVVVPTLAILEEGDLSSVIVQSPDNENEFSLRKVTVTRRERLTTHVRAAAEGEHPATGLAVGEKVVVSGVLSLAAELRLHAPASKK
jgi:multidrug efflux pump subunit AcrA (membrane-fusion protein)